MIFLNPRCLISGDINIFCEYRIAIHNINARYPTWFTTLQHYNSEYTSKAIYWIQRSLECLVIMKHAMQMQVFHKVEYISEESVLKCDSALMTTTSVLHPFKIYRWCRNELRERSRLSASYKTGKLGNDRSQLTRRYCERSGLDN